MTYALLLARQRSGTGALGSVLNHHPRIKFFGEPINIDNVGQEDNYFTHLLEAVREDPFNALPSAQLPIFDSFVARLAERYPDKVLVIDVKYRSLHNLDGGWRGLVERPTLLHHAIESGRPILHLTRRNAVESFVSGRLAEANKVWHADSAERIKVTSTPVNVRQLSNYIVNTERETELISRWTARYPYAVEFDYGEMFDESGGLSDAVAAKIAATLGVEPLEHRKPQFVKQAPPDLRQSIDNFAVVKTALEGTKFAWMVA